MKKLLALLLILSLTSFSSRKALTWIAIGDSITYLNEHLAETDSRISKGYMTRVIEKLPYIHYTNHGYNGWTAVQIAGSIETLGIGKADVYTVFLGTNDWWAGLPVGQLTDYKNNTGNKTVYGAYRIIIDKILNLNRNAKIVLITPMQRGDFVYVGNFKNNAYGSYKENKNGVNLAQFADAIKDIARFQNVELVDLYYKSGITQKNMVKYKRLMDPRNGDYENYSYPGYTNIPFDPNTNEYPYPLDAIDMTYDGLHPSDKGIDVIAKMLVRVMKKF